MKLSEKGINFSSVKERFLSHVSIPEDKFLCWTWCAAKMKSGYGVFGIGARTTYLAHRVSFMMFVGPINDGMEIDHVCHVRWCVNPSHLRPTTHKENSSRPLLGGVAKTNSSKTHCKRGHALTQSNLLKGQAKESYRSCKACHRQRNRIYYINKVKPQHQKEGA